MHSGCSHVHQGLTRLCYVPLKWSGRPKILVEHNRKDTEMKCTFMWRLEGRESKKGSSSYLSSVRGSHLQNSLQHHGQGRLPHTYTKWALLGRPVHQLVNTHFQSVKQQGRNIYESMHKWSRGSAVELSNVIFDRGMTVRARQDGLIILENADPLGFSRTVV